MKKLIETLFILMDPDKPDELWQIIMVREKGGKWDAARLFPKLDSLLRSIAEYYFQTPHKVDKIHALALAAPIVTFSESGTHLQLHKRFLQSMVMLPNQGNLSR